MSGYTTATLMVVGTMVSVVGSLSAGKQAQDEANTNAQGLFQTANAERLTAIEKMKRQKRANAQIQGANRSQNPDKLDLLEDNAREQKLAELDILHAGETNARNYENKARLQIAQGKSARSKGYFGAFSSALMGASMAKGMMPGGGGGLTTAQQTSIINAPSGGYGSPITISR
tara:strand:+ start:1863 stop:2381 length:519 start_codon:yes stop_codon:yes gene_type:complete